VAWSPDGAFLLTCNDDTRCASLSATGLIIAALLALVAQECTAAACSCAVCRLRLFRTDDLVGDKDPSPEVTVPAGELVYDYTWFPGTNAADPATCCFASTCRAHPIHLWDASTGKMGGRLGGSWA
jgi:telomerase Cajal body protein 1